MRVLIAPDGFGGTLTPSQAAAALAEGWRRVRPSDELHVLPLSDGGEGLLDALGVHGGTTHRVEVAGPLGLPMTASWLLRDDGVAVVETAQACGLALVDPPRRDPLRTTTWGVGQLLAAAAAAGPTRMLAGLGGSATVDGGAGALGGLGWAVTAADGSGLKVGGQELVRVAAVSPRWATPLDELALLADVRTPLRHAAAEFGPQKGADADAVAHLARGLEVWRAVVERDLDVPAELAETPGSGAAGGLAYGLAAATGASIVAGVDVVADLVGLDRALQRADLVLTGEGRVDEGSFAGKVVGEVVGRAEAAGVPAVVVAGGATAAAAERVELVVTDDAGPDPSAEVAAAAARVAHGR